MSFIFMSSIFLPSVGILLLIAHMSNSCFCSCTFCFDFHLGNQLHTFLNLSFSFSFFKSLSNLLFFFQLSFSVLLIQNLPLLHQRQFVSLIFHVRVIFFYAVKISCSMSIFKMTPILFEYEAQR